MNEVFFSSDIHFSHRNLINHCDRPYRDAEGQPDVEAMNEDLINRWNWTVTEGDEVWFLGDFSFASKNKSREIFDRLNGTKHLVRGNHDGSDTMKLPWDSTHDLCEVRYRDKKFVLCHFPLEVWHHANGGALHLHGHSHGTLQRVIPGRMDVGVDCHPNYRPFTLDEIFERIGNVNYVAQDHHGNGQESGKNEGY